MRVSFSQIILLGFVIFLLFGDFSNVKKQFLNLLEKLKK
jgi:hypothetical protein